jgi:hypothetical protein
MPVHSGSRLHAFFCSIRLQNACSARMRFCGSLPAIRLALIAPIDVPMIQSGSTPASCSA